MSAPLFFVKVSMNSPQDLNKVIKSAADDISAEILRARKYLDNLERVDPELVQPLLALLLKLNEILDPVVKGSLKDRIEGRFKGSRNGCEGDFIDPADILESMRKRQE